MIFFVMSSMAWAMFDQTESFLFRSTQPFLTQQEARVFVQVSQTFVSEAQVSRLLQKKLRVRHEIISPQRLDQRLLQSPMIEELDLSDTAFSIDTLHEMFTELNSVERQKILNIFQQLKFLNLSRNYLTDEVFLIILEYLNLPS